MGIIRIQHGRAVRRQQVEQFALGPGGGLHGAEEFQVVRPDVRDEADRRAGDLAQPGGLSLVIDAHLHHGRLMTRAQPE